MEIRTQDGQVMFESEFRKLYPNTSFPQIINAETFNEFGATVILEGAQAQPTRYQVAFRDGVEQIDGQWFTKYSVAEIDDEAKTAKDAEQAKSVRQQRDEKLKDTDWTQVADAPVDKEAWATYRQALRDLTKESGFPWDMTWPEQPK